MNPINLLVNKIKLFVFLFLTLSTFAFSQDYKDFLEKADRYAAKGDHENAIENYLKAERLNPGNADVNYRLGKAYLISHAKHKALEFLEKVHALKPNYDPEINYYLGEAYQFNHRFDEAKEHFELFKTKNKKLAEVAEFKIRECTVSDSLVSHPLHVKINNIGHIINSVYDDYSPLITNDGSKFIFTSNRKANENIKNEGANGEFEDIFISTFQNGSWSHPQKISANINSPYNDAAAAISSDGKTLFLYYEEGAGDIYFSTFDGQEWSKAKPLNKNINTSYWETSASISADGKKLYFTSNRPGGFGELDIYVSNLDTDGDWGRAVNLGPAVNTSANEDSPFIHADGTVLYFSSDGFLGLGEHDIFKSEFKNDRWQPAKNLGYPINSAEYEGFFVISEDYTTGYFSSSREDRTDRIGSTDIYKVEFLPEPEKIIHTETPVAIVTKRPHVESTPVIEHTKIETTTEIKQEAHQNISASHVQNSVKEENKESTHTQQHAEVSKETVPINEVPKPKVDKNKKKEEFIDPMVQLQKEMQNVTILKGKVIDAATAAPLGAEITLIDNDRNIVLAKISSHAETGDFEISIPHGGNYGVATELDGYLFNSINFDLPNFSEYMELDTHILMQKSQVGSKVTLKNLFFDSGKSNLKTQSLSELENIREFLILNPALSIQINGHTDNVGKAMYNKTLSLKRAQSVVDYLIQHGINPVRLSAVGYGSERPIVSNDDEAGGRALNRRTEIEIIEAKKK